MSWEDVSSRLSFHGTLREFSKDEEKDHLGGGVYWKKDFGLVLESERRSSQLIAVFFSKKDVKSWCWSSLRPEQVVGR